jgi:L-malate glycosyltransferase
MPTRFYTTLAISQFSVSKIKILHITPWFPSLSEPIKAIFIQRHIESLAPFAQQHVLHMEWEKKPHQSESSVYLTRCNAFTGINNWQWKEWVYYKRLAKELKDMDAAAAYTHVNFHIAYPQLVHFHRLKHLLPAKVVITEHWSIYHFNFFSKKQPHRLASMFLHQVPLICVSHALGQSINEFTAKPVEYTVIPNAVDTAVFNFKNSKRGSHFLLAAHWKFPKDASQILQACMDLKSKGTELNMRIAGNGLLWDKMKKQVTQYGLQNNVTFLGLLNAEQLAVEMNEAAAFIMPSGFETFSASCAEALCCGCPVLADGVGALPELINTANGLLRDASQTWQSVILQFQNSNFDHEQIAENSQKKYDLEIVGKTYFNFIQSL